MHSHHSHSGQFCRHANGALSEVAQAAVLKGFSVYGLTEHAPRYRTRDLYPEESDLSIEDLSSAFDTFVNEAHNVREEHSSSATAFLVGLETDYITDLDLVMTENLLARHGDKFDYIVGSIHHVNEIPIDFDRETFERALGSFGGSDAPDSTTASLINQDIPQNYQDLIISYLDSQYKLMQGLHPEIIGHFDLFRLYNPSITFSASSTPAIWERIMRNVQYAIEYGALFEANAAAFRKGWDTAYPGKEIARLIVDHGGRFALSDDSHGPEFIGLNYSRLRAYLHDVLEVPTIYHLEQSRVCNRGGRKVRAVASTGLWWEDPFWKQV
ncbi:histidinol-phosphatase [Cantharellus anzutake]|uniref:histidinol-phosphatase n=1 Tax=Cantharellus anzutake TaxID=1750568 RepID=UPI00190721F8|nr:histidinol-phosphatase [Cantharellus anzutake]KAF8333022.1 histidinol-phosphatase [Cantharellus anzutake]